MIKKFKCSRRKEVILCTVNNNLRKTKLNGAICLSCFKILIKSIEKYEKNNF